MNYLDNVTIKYYDREEYERNLAKRQREHLRKVYSENWRPCLHDACPQCLGTGVKHDGSSCIHMISCPCPSCTPYY